MTTQYAPVSAGLDAVPVPIVVADLQGRIAMVNAAASTVLGMLPIGAPLGRYFILDDADPDDVFSAGGGHRVIGATVVASGRPTPVRLDVNATHDAVTVAFRFIDEEIRRAGRLRSVEGALRQLAASVPVGILSSEQGMRADFVNDRCCSVFGTHAEALLGFGWLDFIDDADAVAAEDGLAHVIEDLSEVRLALRVNRPDGEVRYVEVCAAPVAENGRDIGFVASIQDVTSAHEANQLLEMQARSDPLTGLPNRLVVSEATAGVAATRQSALLFVDLDNFKYVNDSLGHGAGDVLLCVVADRLRMCTREEDTVVRFGGDEFVVVIGDAPGSEAVRAIADRILREIAEPVQLGEIETRVTASVGIVSVPAAVTAHQVDALLRDADIAMYESKRLGKNRITLFDGRMRDGVQRRLELDGALRRALAEDAEQLTVCYQPIVDLPSGRIVGVEALLRWWHPEQGPIPPDVFIPVAEETGLISALGRLVLRRAVAAVAATRTLPGQEDLYVSVNMSANDLSAPDLVSAVRDTLAANLLPPTALRLELTESAVMADAAQAKEVLAQLKALGVCISIDDFGTGYSSLSYLQLLPVDMIKIDRSFVADLASSRVLVEAVAALARAWNMPVVAEGVETSAQAAFLTTMGVEYAQGFLYSPAVPLDELRKMLGG